MTETQEDLFDELLHRTAGAVYPKDYRLVMKSLTDYYIIQRKGKLSNVRFDGRRWLIMSNDIWYPCDEKAGAFLSEQFPNPAINRNVLTTGPLYVCCHKTNCTPAWPDKNDAECYGTGGIGTLS